MKNYKVISKRDYRYSQDNSYIIINKYIVFLKDNKKYLMLNLTNNSNQNLKSYNFELVQKDIDGNYIATSNFSETRTFISKKTRFTPNYSLELNDNCEDVQLELKNAVFDNIIFDDGKVYNISNSDDKKLDDGVKERKIKKLPLKYSIIPLFITLLTIVASFVWVDYYKKNTFKFTIDNYEYSFADENLNEDSDIIIDKYNGKESNILIPEKIMNHNIIEIADSAFRDNDYIKNVKFESEVKINQYAFDECENLTSVNFDKIRYIGKYAFAYCNNLDSFNTNKIEYIGEGAFLKSGLKEVSIDTNGKLNIEKDVFIGCRKLKNFNFNSEINETPKFGSLINDCDNIENLYIKDYTNFFGNNRLYDIIGSNNSKLKSFKTEHLSQLSDSIFKNFKNLETIEIKNLDSSLIENEAFRNCISLKNLNIDKKITKIGYFAFEGTKINQFDAGNVSTIGDGAFSDCTELENFKLSNECKNIGKMAFRNCSKLKEILLPNSITKIGNETFINCKSLKNIYIDDSINLTEIGDRAFANCESLSKLELNPTFSIIGEECFAGCSSLLKFDLGSMIKEIPTGTFKNCGALMNINDIISENIQVIHDDAFYGCNAINDLIIPSNISSIGKYAFSNCNGLKTVVYNENVVNDTINNSTFAKCDNLQKVTLPSNIRTLNNSAFKDCTRLENINLPDSLNIIEDSVFENCGMLKSLIIPNNIHRVGSLILKECNSLENLTIPFVGSYINEFQTFEYLFGDTIPFGLTTINITKQTDIPRNFISNMRSLEKIEFNNTLSFSMRAFNDCSNLKTVLINDEAKSIEYPLFYNCPNVETIKLPSLLDNNGSERYLKELFLNSGYYNENNLKNVTIAKVSDISSKTLSECRYLEELHFSEIDRISDNAFAYKENLKIIDLGSGTINIPNECFYYCKSLEEAILGDRTFNIGKSAFWGCINLKQIDLPANLNVIEDNVFRDCKQLKTITIPESLTSIGGDAFFGCNSLYEIINLSTVNLKDNNYYIDDLVINYVNDVTQKLKTFNIENNTFAIKDKEIILVYLDDNKKEDVILPSNVEYRGEKVNYTIKRRLFYDNYYIKDIVIPSCVKKIDKYAFANSSITNVMFEKNSLLETIGAYAFANNNIEKIFLPEGLKTITENSFSDCNKLITVSIPSTIETIEDYAFRDSNTILEIYNLSKLNFELETDSYGSIARNALIIHKSFDEEPLNKVIIDGIVAYISGDLCVLNKLTENKGKVINFPSNISYNNRIYDSYRIGNNFFRDYQYRYDIEEINIPKAVTEIGDSSFSSLEHLKKVNIEEGSKLKKIKSNAFIYCYELYSINLPVSLESIGSWAFHQCFNICSISLGENLKQIQYGAFKDCHSLIEIYNFSKLDISNFEETGHVAENAIVIRKDKTEKGYDFFEQKNFLFYVDENGELTLMKYLGDVNNVTTPDNINRNGKTYDKYSIYKYAFTRNNIYEIIITKNVKSIGEYAFSNIYNLKKVTFNDDSIIKEISNNCFQNCENLSLIILPSNLETIGSEAFRYCSGLSQITLPKTVTSIGDLAFANCDSLFAVINYSDLKLNKGDSKYGNIATNCQILFNKPINEVEIINGQANYNYAFYDVMLINNELYLLSDDNSSNNPYILPKNLVFNNVTYDSYIIAGKMRPWTETPVIIIPKSVKSIFKNTFDKTNNLSLVCYEGSKEEWEMMKINDVKILSTKIKFYNSCVHDNESWTYSDNNLVVYNYIYENKKVIKEPTCTESGIVEFDCNLCKSHIVTKLEPVKHVPGTICKHCNKKVSANNHVYNLFYGNFDLYNTNNAYKIRNHENQNNAELYSLYNMIGTYEFDFIIYPENEKDELKFYLNDKLIKTYTTKDGFVHYSIDLKQNDNFKIVYEIADNNMSSKDLFYMKNLMFLS